jgi:hypothetical protein
MAYEIPGFVLGVLPANADMSVESTNQFTAVSVVAATLTTGTGVGGGSVQHPAASGDPAVGVLQNNPLLGEAAAVMVGGVSKAVLASSVSVGDLLMTSPAGTLGLATSGKYAIAQALESGVAGDIAAVLLIRNGKV